MATRLIVNQRAQDVDAAPDTPLLYVLSNNLELQGRVDGLDAIVRLPIERFETPSVADNST